MKILTVLGARPQFIKAAPVSKALREAGQRDFVVHTGQHYDHRMSQIFFDELGLPQPDVNLGVGSGTHGWQTGTALIRLEEVLLREQPDWVLVYGDTNSTLAGALAAAKLHLPIAHVEAGLRSFNRQMPEEHNRVLTDHCADLLFCPTQTAVENLSREGVSDGVHWVGDTMYDAVLQFAQIAAERSSILDSLQMEPRSYLLATLHRPYNTDIPERLGSILSAFTRIEEPIVFPVHPRTRACIAALDERFTALPANSRVHFLDPVGYLDMLKLEQNARLILTDSGGIQKEAYFLGVPCITLRPETEWVETVSSGWNTLADWNPDEILRAVSTGRRPQVPPPPVFGIGRAAHDITDILCSQGRQATT